MNYQTTALWFYNPYILIVLALCLGCVFLGLTSPLFYIIMTGVILPVVVSMRLHTLSEAGNAWLIKERSEWMLYLTAIPIQEQRSTLNNPCFSSPERLKQFYLRGFGGKLAIQVVALVMLFNQGKEIELMSFAGLVEGILVCLLVILLASTFRTLSQIRKQQWDIQTVTSKAGTQWYQAFFLNKQRAQPALNKLCSLV
ncbi:MAG: hypothetical protein ACRCWW_17395 [Scandinavium sp.]|uniref:hypothetical protein n=1 Tax=Scandinavium sp. TaxID=2830653 RepID=UPI003F2AA3A4